MSTGTGARLLLPLTKLVEPEAPPAAPAMAPPMAPPVAPPAAPPPAPSPARAPQRLDLDAPLTAGGWVAAVRGASEACLLLDAEGRVAAASPNVFTVLGGSSVTGARFADLVRLVDFTSGAAPELEPERSMPPLRALMTGGLARGLMRLRVTDGSLVTYDVVAVALQGHRGVLAFFLPV